MCEHDVILHDVVRLCLFKMTKCVRKFRMAAAVCLTMASHTAWCLYAGRMLVTYITGGTGDTCCCFVSTCVDASAVDEPSQHFCCHVISWGCLLGCLWWYFVQRYHASMGEVLDENELEHDVPCSFWYSLSCCHRFSCWAIGWMRTLTRLVCRASMMKLLTYSASWAPSADGIEFSFSWWQGYHSLCFWSKVDAGAK